MAYWWRRYLGQTIPQVPAHLREPVVADSAPNPRDPCDVGRRISRFSLRAEALDQERDGPALAPGRAVTTRDRPVTIRMFVPPSLPVPAPSTFRGVDA